jgi:hypothetical protein
VVESAVPAIRDAFAVQPIRKYETSVVTANGPRNEVTPIPSVAFARSHVDRIDLHPGEEGQDDRGELGDEVEPLRRVEIEDVADDDAERQFKQGNGDAELDREHRGKQHHCPEYGCQLDGAHADLLLRVCSDVR